MKMKKKMKSKLIVAAMTLAMVFTMMPMMGAPAYADDPAPPAPSIAQGPDVLSIGSNTSGAATVHMAGTKWLVIGYGVSQKGGVTQVASSADTMTLIAGDNLKTGVQFNPDSNQVNTYKDSNLYNEVNALTDDTNGIFSKGEKEGIVARDLAKGGYTGQAPYTNGIAGDEVKGALLWPLSTQEAYYMDSELRIASDYWWLRSPGIFDDYPAFVTGRGGVNDTGYVVGGEEIGVRPAFNLNLSSVLFTSAAAGGKSSDEGKLSEVGTNDSGEWKLTVKDDAHKEFKFKNFFFYVDDKNLMGIKFSGALDATAEKKEYISAIILSKDNKVKYYGKITPAASGNNQECIIELDDKMAGGDTLYVFNEQCNKDAVIENGVIKKPAETDYSSELKKVFTAPELSITTQPQNKELTYGDTAGNTLQIAAKAEEGCTLSYQWYRKDSENAEPVSLKNETSASYTVPADQNVGTTKYYYCKVRATRTDGTWATETSNQAAVTVSRAKLTIKAKDQTFTYNGKDQGPADAVYENPSAIYVDAEGIADGEILESVTIDGQRKEAGTSDLTITGCMVRNSDGEDVRDNYNIEYVSGKLIIDKANITITADDKSSKAGEALKELTYKVNGDIVQGDDLGITVTTDADKDKAGTYDIKVGWNNNKNYEASLVNGKYTVTAVPIPVPPAPKTSGTPLAKAKAKKKSMTIGWSKIEGAEGYDIFFATCNHSHKKIACKNVKTIKGNKTFKWTKSGLKKGTAYKFYVRAYVTKNGKKTYVSKSPIMHAYTGNGNKKYTNAKSVKIRNVKKGKLSLVQGKTFKIKASVKKLKKNRKLMPKSHAPALRYMTSDGKVATVSKSGKITAKSSGTCYIYVYAHNGVSKSIRLVVK